jgi:hypothetical protein
MTAVQRVMNWAARAGLLKSMGRTTEDLGESPQRHRFTGRPAESGALALSRCAEHRVEPRPIR